MSIKEMKVPRIKDAMGMNILNALIYHKEVLRRETNLIKREVSEKRIIALKLEWKKHIA